MCAFVSLESEETVCEIIACKHYLKNSPKGTQISVERARFNSKMLSLRTNTPSSNKIYVSGIPLECTRLDVLNYFSRFGEVKAVLLPKKKVESNKDSLNTKENLRRTGRGFAFVTFFDSQTAKKVLGLNHLFEGKKVT